MKQIIIALLILAAIAGLILFVFKAPAAVEQTPAPEMSTYKSAEYEFSLSYPTSLQVKEYLPSDIVFGHIDGEMVNGVAEARVVVVEGESGKTFQESAASQLQNLCAADGPNGSFSCTGLKDLKMFTTDSGIPGYRIMLEGELKDFTASTTISMDKGPYYAFLLGTSATASSVLVIHPPLNQYAADADEATITAIAKSVTF